MRREGVHFRNDIVENGIFNAAMAAHGQVAGDFFRDALPICAAYLVMEVIHDWGDDQATAILKEREIATGSDISILEAVPT